MNFKKVWMNSQFEKVNHIKITSLAKYPIFSCILDIQSKCNYFDYLSSLINKCKIILVLLNFSLVISFIFSFKTNNNQLHDTVFAVAEEDAGPGVLLTVQSYFFKCQKSVGNPKSQMT